MRGRLILAGCLVLTCGLPAAAQVPPPAAQNPSPMVETTRAHERLRERALAGERREVQGPWSRPIDVYAPTRLGARPDLVIHFHGDAWIAHTGADRQRAVSAVVNLGAGTGVYHRAFAEPGAFDTLIALIERDVAARRGRAVSFGRIVLSGFSAGHGAIRVILRDTALVRRVDAVLLLDGMHTSYIPEGQVLAAGGVLDTTNLVALAGFARLAMRGERRFVVTHSEIFPGTFASTTETANWLLASLGVPRRAVLAWGPHGMQRTSVARAGRFEVHGYAGNSAPDHVDHYHALPEYLERLLRR